MSFTASLKTTRNRGYIQNYAPQLKTQALLTTVQEVLDEYRKYWPLTVRQIFYRLVGAHGFDKSEAAYGRLCHHLANARRALVIPFEAIRDDGVSTIGSSYYDDADHFMKLMRDRAETYRRDLMADQPLRIEIWCEAAGMLTQMYRVADRYCIPVFSSSGFDSLTAKKTMADRICTHGKPAVILHLGDYDPSGESIFEAVSEDVAAFVAADRPWATVDVRFQRVALTESQVADFNLPTSPAKATDSRSKTWTGGTCQLEALAPDQIAGLLSDAIAGLLDPKKYRFGLALEKEERIELTRLLLTGPGSAKQ